MKTVFSYTDKFSPDSSAVDNAWYHEVSRELALDLHGVVYKYSGVDSDAWEDLKDSVSAGRYYRNVIQREFKPALRLGLKGDIYFQREYVPVVAESMSSVHEGTTTMPVSQNRVGASNRPAVSGWGVQRPKQFASGGVVSAPVTSTRTGISLVTENVPAPLLKHVVTFLSDGKERQHTLKVRTVQEAVNAVNEIADMLDLTFDVKKVEVFFE